MRLNYSWSHAIDNISNTFSETAVEYPNLGLLAPLNPGLDKGSADFDIRHRVTLAGIWEIPYKGSNAITRQVLGGWTLTPNISARTGSPILTLGLHQQIIGYYVRVSCTIRHSKRSTRKPRTETRTSSIT